ncbi:hypothetical protein RDWZM_004509 [Blomia tropicalis]|uniref:Uncharacterized protein n=1 Tax=Blomia tropicalis TaxID=40697 RepID=A0A9Q0M628_BLOTA|nr:hypothetical protein RDWZM_004509 [Blomia tropicalis]
MQCLFTNFQSKTIKEPNRYGLNCTDNLRVNSTTDRTIQLGVWHTRPSWRCKPQTESDRFKDAQLVILYVHGAGGTRAKSFRVSFYRRLTNELNVDIISFDYRSFADSSDHVAPSAPGLANDTFAMLRWIQSHSVPSNKIMIWAHSLGTAVSIRMWAENIFQDNQLPLGLVLEAPFTSLKDEIEQFPPARWFKWLPWFNYCIRDPIINNPNLNFDSISLLHRIERPIMILHSLYDPIIPFEQGLQLYQRAKMVQPKMVANKTVLHLFHNRNQCGHVCITTEVDLIQKSQLISMFITISIIVSLSMIDSTVNGNDNLIGHDHHIHEMQETKVIDDDDDDSVTKLLTNGKLIQFIGMYEQQLFIITNRWILYKFANNSLQHNNHSTYLNVRGLVRTKFWNEYPNVKNDTMIQKYVINGFDSWIISTLVKTNTNIELMFGYQTSEDHMTDMVTRTDTIFLMNMFQPNITNVTTDKLDMKLGDIPNRINCVMASSLSEDSIFYAVRRSIKSDVIKDILIKRYMYQSEGKLITQLIWMSICKHDAKHDIHTQQLTKRKMPFILKSFHLCEQSHSVNWSIQSAFVTDKHFYFLTDTNVIVFDLKAVMELNNNPNTNSTMLMVDIVDYTEFVIGEKKKKKPIKHVLHINNNTKIHSTTSSSSLSSSTRLILIIVVVSIIIIVILIYCGIRSVDNENSRVNEKSQSKNNDNGYEERTNEYGFEPMMNVYEYENVPPPIKSVNVVAKMDQPIKSIRRDNSMTNVESIRSSKNSVKNIGSTGKKKTLTKGRSSISNRKVAKTKSSTTKQQQHRKRVTSSGKLISSSKVRTKPSIKNVRANSSRTRTSSRKNSSAQ